MSACTYTPANISDNPCLTDNGRDLCGEGEECLFFGDHIECQCGESASSAEPVCDANATCVQTDGASACLCNEGLAGDGLSCGCPPGYEEISEETTEESAGEGIECAKVVNCGLTNSCDPLAICDDDGSFTSCGCPDGYDNINGDGTLCKDTINCGVDDNCGLGATCIDAEGSFSCTCSTGYDDTSGDGTVCEDIINCGVDDNCDELATCLDGEGSFSCTCPEGYRDTHSDGMLCEEIDECALDGTNNCTQLCVNDPGDFHCECIAGYELDLDGFSCFDVDGCILGGEVCAQLCVDDLDGFHCECNAGYLLNADGQSCDDINECDTSNGGCTQNCFNDTGSFSCTCNDGYVLNADGLSCDDVDECLTDNGGCNALVTCINTVGGFSCEACPAGYVDTNGDGTLCSDINECDTSNGGCAQNCFNETGSFYCTCEAGYVLNVDGLGCDDLNECETDDNNCDANALCTNVPDGGGFSCACNSGWTGEGTVCTDLNECTTDNNNCDVINATCTNVLDGGGFTCTCNSGWTGDGTVCTDLNECTTGDNNCDVNALCTNVPDGGGFSCACNSGWTGDGTVCTDLNECTTGDHNCDPAATCANTDGSFTCTCSDGFSDSFSNGTECVPYLSDLITSSSEMLNPVFDSLILDYELVVLVGEASITFTPSAVADLTITVDGIPVSAGIESQPITLNLGSNTVTIVVEANGQARTYFVDVLRGERPITYIKASNTGDNDRFGYSVSLDGDTLAVGSPYESSAAIGIDGDQADDSAEWSGAVYVFIRQSGVWSQQAYIKPFNTEAGDIFGLEVSLDGESLAVGAIGEQSSIGGINTGFETDNSQVIEGGGGAVYVFVRSGTVWTQQAYIKASNTGDGDGFGAALQLDGDTLAVGAYLEDSRGVGVNGDEVDHPSGEDSGAVYVFKRTDASWVQEAYIKMDTIISPAQFGLSVALEADTLVAGADRTDVAAGLVVSFTRLGSVWTQEAVITPTLRGDNDQFGFSLDLFADTLAVGAVGEDSAALGVNTGGETDDSALNSGAVYVFTRAAGLWTQEAYIKASNVEADDVFGYHVSLEQNRLGVGAKGESSAATGYDGDESDNSVVSSGAVYLFSRSAGAWSQTSYLKASNTNSLDYFGFALSLSGADLAVGAYWEQSTATGIDGDQTDNSFSTGAGAVYVTQP